VTGPGLAASILDAFLGTGFEGGRHKRRIDLIEPGD
ncbi:MAG: RpiB/LacA/LacB family sugar-phosphate isomerase, partial [Thermodesulfobacteriota bacterium]|nr:RpiB/LacA/LacB family sugar-phosphate isomerase [Thermodesulfobacteriota bacterium]